MIGIQAQDLTSAHLSVRARTGGLTRADVERARIQERSIIWTWAMRGTLHLVATADASWLLPLVAPSPESALPRLAQLSMPREKAEEAAALIARIVRDTGALRRSEIVEQLARYGLRVHRRVAFHLIRLAAFRGEVCLGAVVGRDTMIVPMPSDAGPRRQGGGAAADEHALAELGRRYVKAYGPAAAADLAAWSGLPFAAVRRALAGLGREFRGVEIAGEQLLMAHPRPQHAGGTVRLLPAYDAYLLGYRNRDFAIPSSFAARVHPGGGLFRPTVVEGGTVVATWRFTRPKRRSGIAVAPFAGSSATRKRAVSAEALDVGRFLGMEAGI